jgi:hypothetical protein
VLQWVLQWVAIIITISTLTLDIGHWTLDMPDDCESVCCLSSSLLSLSHLSSFLFKQIIASSAGSAIATLTLNPINVLKVHLQTPQSSLHQKAKYAQLVPTIKNVYLSHGLKGFWAGTSSGLVMAVPNTIIYMSTYEAIKAKLHNLPSSDKRKLLYTGLLFVCINLSLVCVFVCRYLFVSNL